MGDHFKTDTDQLGQFLRSLRQSLDDLKEARTALAHVRAGEIGTERLDEACDTFQQRWKYGADQLHEQISEISKGVKKNKDNYQQLEEDLEKYFNKLNHAGGGH